MCEVKLKTSKKHEICFNGSMVQVLKCYFSSLCDILKKMLLVLKNPVKTNQYNPGAALTQHGTCVRFCTATGQFTCPGTYVPDDPLNDLMIYSCITSYY